MKNKIIIGIIVSIFLMAIVTATFYPEPWGNNQDANNQNITNVDYITANYFDGDLTGGIDGELNMTGQNISAINCIVFDSGGRICSGV